MIFALCNDSVETFGGFGTSGMNLLLLECLFSFSHFFFPIFDIYSSMPIRIPSKRKKKKKLTSFLCQGCDVRAAVGLTMAVYSKDVYLIFSVS